MKMKNLFYKKAYLPMLLVACLGGLLYFLYGKENKVDSDPSQLATIGTHIEPMMGNRIKDTPNLKVQGEVYQIVSPGQAVNALLFSKDGKNLIVGRSDSNKWGNSQTVEFWDLKSRKKRPNHEVAKSNSDSSFVGISQIACSLDGKVMATLHLDGKVHIWNTASFSENVLSSAILTSALGTASVQSIGFTSTGKMLLHTDTHSHILEFDLKNGILSETMLVVPQESVVTFSPVGGDVEIGSWQGKKFDIKLFNWKTGRQTHFIGSYDTAPGLLTFSPNGKFLAIPTNGGLEIWNTFMKKLEENFPRSEWAGQSVAFASTIPLVASDNNDGDVYLWNLQSKSQPTIISTGGTEAKLAFSPKGDMLAGGFENGVVKLWRIE